MNQLVYIASPLSGDVAHNLDFARQACRYAIAQGVTPFAPHLLYPQMLPMPSKRLPIVSVIPLPSPSLLWEKKTRKGSPVY